MELGYAVPNNQGVSSVHSLVELAQRAEQLGYRSAWVSEHLFHSTYVAQRLGDKPYHDPLTVLTAIACATQTIRLGTSVLVLPWHHPARLGKTIATLDHLSNGRVDMGVGVAITEDEFENLGIPFHTRGAQTNDRLSALQALWYEDMPTHKGDFYSFSNQRFEPKPLQARLPIHVGGGANAALKRVVQFGQGWHALGKSPAELEASMQQLSQLMAAAGRGVDELHISIRCVVQFVDEQWDKPAEHRRTLKGTEAEIKEVIKAFAQAGVDELVIDPGSADGSYNVAIMERVKSLL